MFDGNLSIREIRYENSRESLKMMHEQEVIEKIYKLLV